MKTTARRFLSTILIICLVALTKYMIFSIDYAYAAGNLYYVSTSGNDANDGLATGTAWRHIAYAATQASGGDTIKVLAGTFENEIIVFSNSGNSENWIKLETYNGTVTINGTGSGTAISATDKSYIQVNGEFVIDNYGSGISFGYSDHISISDVRIYNTTGDGMSFHRDTTAYITLDNVIVENAGDHGILFFGYPYTSALIEHVTVTNSVVKNSHHNGIDLHTNIHYATIENNTFSGVTNSAAIFSHNSNNKHITIKNNKIDNCTRGIWALGTDDSLIEGNVISNCSSAYGIFLYSASGYPGVHNVVIKNNTIQNSLSYDAFLYTDGSSESPPFSNITFENNSMTTQFRVQSATSESITMRNMADNSRTYNILSAASNFKIEFTDGRIFSVNGTGEYATYTIPSTGTYAIEVVGWTNVGNISGTVTDVDTGLPVEGAIVSDGTRSDTTDSNGEYEIAHVPVGTHTVTCTKTGYENASQLDVIVNDNATTMINYELLLLQGDMTPPEITLKTITVNGSVDDDSVTSLDINGVTVSVTGGTYFHQVDVSSISTITITATNGDGKTVTRTITVK